MKTFAPNYYPAFRCLAGACRHSCCIGWEIDIDPETLARYRKVEGEFGARLRENITETEEGNACFALQGAEERCPFLNKRGLCDIFSALGEDALCQICTDHPRFRNFFSGRTEIGLGLCCEGAADLLLRQKEPVTWCLLTDDGEDTPLTPEEAEFLALREKVFAALQDRNVPLARRLERMVALCGGRIQERADWPQVYLSLERLEDAWEEILQEWAVNPARKADFSAPCPEIWEQLAVYFAFRHLADGFFNGDLLQRAAFVVRSCIVLAQLASLHKAKTGGLTEGDVADLARMYSSEIEYSEENMDALLELCGEG